MLRAASFMGIVAAIASAPLNAILSNFLGTDDVIGPAAYFVLPLVIGIIAMGWWVLLQRLIRLRSRRGLVIGIFCGVLTFFTFAALFDVSFHRFPSGGPLGQTFIVIATWGFGMFGWIAVIGGGLAGWFAEKQWTIQ